MLCTKIMIIGYFLTELLKINKKGDVFRDVLFVVNSFDFVYTVIVML